MEGQPIEPQMSTSSTLPRCRLRFSLQSLLTLSTCVAIGLLTGPHGEIYFECIELSAKVGEINWFNASLGAASTAMVIGLLQEARALLIARAAFPTDDRSLRFAVLLEVVWRIFLSVILAGCLTARLLVKQRGFEPAGEYLFLLPLGDLFTNYVWWMAIAVVLAASISRAPSRGCDPVRRFESAALVGGVLVLLLGAIHFTRWTFQTHVDVAAMDASQVHQAGRYRLLTPDSQAMFFGAACVAMIAWLASALLVVDWLRRWRIGKRILLKTLFTLVPLTIAAGYCVWYLKIGLPMASPDFAEAPINTTAFDTITLPVVAITLVTGLALRFSRSDCDPSSIWDVPVRTPFYKSPVCGAMIAGSGIYCVYLATILVWDPLRRRAPTMDDLWYFWGYYAVDVTSLLPLAIVILGWQLAWKSWKFRGRSAPLTVMPVDPFRFATTWVVLAATLGIGLEMILAFSFSFWLGPWYLL
jgi:hypothetical protein